jgi:hypothetical protein
MSFLVEESNILISAGRSDTERYTPLQFVTSDSLFLSYFFIKAKLIFTTLRFL